MGWGGIANLPPGFDVFAGKQGATNVVDEAIRGHINGMTNSQVELFRDLRRHLLHRDYARYFEYSLLCAEALRYVDEGRQQEAAIRDVVEPALATAVEQMESIRSDMERYAAASRRPEYDGLTSLDQLFRKSRPIAAAYPGAKGAPELENRYNAIALEIRRLAGPPPGGPNP